MCVNEFGVAIYSPVGKGLPLLPIRLYLFSCLFAVCSPAELGQAQSQPNPDFANSAKVEVRGDLSFLDSDRPEKLDLYLPKNRPAGSKSPAVLWIHGGGWKEGDKRQAREIEFGTTLAENGYVVASANYALRSEGKFPINLQDCKNAVRYLRSHAKELDLDPDRIAVMGGSAGGHLALLVAYTADDSRLSPPTPYPGISDKVSCVVDFYGITDLASRKKTDAEGKPTTTEPLNDETKKIMGTTPADWKKASPLTYVRREVPPTMIIHGRKDTTVDRDQSQQLADALRKSGAVYDLVWLNQAGHSFSMKYENPKQKKALERDLTPTVLSFLKKYLPAR